MWDNQGLQLLDTRSNYHLPDSLICVDSTPVANKEGIGLIQNFIRKNSFAMSVYDRKSRSIIEQNSLW